PSFASIRCVRPRKGIAMEGYLHVRAGRLGMLLPVAGVLEVLEVERAGITAGHAVWRETSLPVLSAHALLGEPDGEGQSLSEGSVSSLCSAVVYTSAPATPPCMILVDRVAGLTQGTDFTPLRRAPADAARFFAATAGGIDGERLYCLSRPLASLDLPVAAASPGEADRVADEASTTKSVKRVKSEAGGKRKRAVRKK
ncbi:MAG: hypothetical protein WAZ34_07880, partial [Rhodocyclaceae bacterium]